MSIVNSFFVCGVQRFTFARIDEEEKMRPSCCARTPCWPPPLLRRREDGRGTLHLQMVPAMIKEPTATNTCLEEFQQLPDATDGEQFAKAPLSGLLLFVVLLLLMLVLVFVLGLQPPALCRSSGVISGGWRSCSCLSKAAKCRKAPGCTRGLAALGSLGQAKQERQPPLITLLLRHRAGGWRPGRSTSISSSGTTSSSSSLSA